MKTIIYTFKTIFLIICIITLSSESGWGAANWSQARYGAVGFSIGSKGYIATGFGYINNAFAYKKDLWEYNPATNSWTQKADLGGTGRAHATGFSIGNKGYVGTGQDGSTLLSDFWEYDPNSNIWLQKADFPGLARKCAPGFSIGSKGYLGTGMVFYPAGPPLHLQDFWEYDPATNSWLQKSDFPGTARFAAVGFNIGDKGYLGSGAFWVSSTEYIYYNDFYEYSQVNNIWTLKAPFTGLARCSATGFGIGSKGYIGTGINNGNLLNDFYEYNPITNAWTKKANFKGKARKYATGFSIGTKGYLGTGIVSANPCIQDFFEYNPGNNVWTQKADLGGKSNGALKEGEISEERFLNIREELTVYPNPSTYSFNFSLKTTSDELVSIKIIDITGRLVREYSSLKPDEIITIGEDLGVGIYVAVLTQGIYRKTVKLNKVR